MATTTNFGWETPDDTDLVKDGAAAIRTLGNSIDTSMVDLKGGTTNQILAKNSNTDLDFKWVSDATGMTNPMTTTGDTIYSSSGSTPARLGIGTAGQVLTVNSGASAPEWATPVSGGMTLLSTTNLSGSTVTISSISQAYNTLYVLVENVDFGSYSGFNVNIDSSTTNFYGITVQANQSGSVGTNQNINVRVSEQWSGWKDNNTNGVVAIWIENYASTTGRKPVYASYGWTGWTGSADVVRAGWTAGAWLSTSAVDSMQFDTASFDSGTVKIYGVK